jgi:hypothetical protein
MSVYKNLTTKNLATLLLRIKIEESAGAYESRNLSVVHTVALAMGLGLEAGFRIDPKEPEWPVAFIELPTGQVSWHIPQHTKEWDNHTTEEKFSRIMEFAENES